MSPTSLAEAMNRGGEMAYREITMLEIKEVLRQLLLGTGKKKIADRLGIDPKTVQRYWRIAEAQGVKRSDGLDALTEGVVAAVVTAATTVPGRPHGEAWALCETHRDRIKKRLDAGVRLTKVRRELVSSGIVVPYPTLHRFAQAELGFGRPAVTMPVVDGKPGEELQIDTGWMSVSVSDDKGRVRQLRAWIFTPVVSRYRFVYPCFVETTETAIEACEAAWRFYGGVFKVAIPDNTKVIVDQADDVAPRLNRTFLEYAQSRGFVVDPARVRRPTDKARTERSVRYVREDCFAGETFTDLQAARTHAERWCQNIAGLKTHASTYRKSREHFEADERAALLPAPQAAYDVPRWSEPKVSRDHYAQVGRGLYSLPTRYIGDRLMARADSKTVRFYDGATLVKTHMRVAPGQRATDTADFPPARSPYAFRAVDAITAEMSRYGAAIAEYVALLLAGPHPWRKMRSTYRLRDLVSKYGRDRVEAACLMATGVAMVDVRRLERVLELGVAAAEGERPAEPLPAKYQRPAAVFAVRPSEEDRR
jgi:transposase